VGEQRVAPIVEPATTPTSEDGTALTWPAAPALGEVQYVANRDSVLLVLPEVANARDYRVFRAATGVTIADQAGAEMVTGATIHCAGYRQRHNEFMGTRELLRVVEVTNLTADAVLVVEALDTACPYSGAIAPRHEDIIVDSNEVPFEDRVPFSLWTPAEVRTRFGSLILNGHGKGTVLASPGDPAPPRVLARTTVRVTTAGKATPRTADFFEDFDGTSGPIVASGTVTAGGRVYKEGRRFSNSKWDYFLYNDHENAGQITEERGILNVVLPDWGQGVFASMIGVPRRPAAMSATKYLHFTWEVESNPTPRRYWWIAICGAGAPGQTFDAQQHLAGNLIQTPFFYESDARNTSLEGWNCLQFFPRDGWPFDLGPGFPRTESDILVMVNHADAGVRDSVVNVSPAQYPPAIAPAAWFRQQDGAGNLGPAILDDAMFISPRTRFDGYLKRDRLVLYVNGKQRLCNDFPTNALTMAEAAVGFGQVLYHSSAERMEFSRDFDMRTGQRYYLENGAYVDQREWDNVGYEESVGAPSDFDPTQCFVFR
jgi:hypothetical protein